LITSKMYSEEYTAAYNRMMDGMVERRMRSAIKMVADIWFTCWVNAGSPDLNDSKVVPLSPEEQQQAEAEEKAWKEKKQQFGHYHPESGGDGVK
jgi:hypothetical protein